MRRSGIALLPPDALTVTQNDPEFSTIVAESLGNEITDDDGWDRDLDDLIHSFDGGQDLLDGMAGHIPDSDFVDGDVDNNLLQPVAADTAQHIADGDPLFSAMVDAVTPPPPPPPPNGGGGGGGGGGSACKDTGDCPGGFVCVDGVCVVPAIHE